MSHRKVDVDELVVDEDAYNELTVDESEEALNLLIANANDRLVNSKEMMSRGDFQSSLNILLSTPAITCTHPTLSLSKQQILQSIFNVLSQVKSTDIDQILNNLNTACIDILMQYLYKGMELPATYNAAVLLLWHEKAVEVGGVGSIARCLTNRAIV